MGMGTFADDVRFALRSWRRAPFVIAAAVVAIAAGVAANTTIFSFVSAMLLQPLPYPDPDRVVHVWQDYRTISGRQREWTSPGLFLEWRERSIDALSAIAVVGGWGPTLVEGVEPERIPGASVSAAYFSILGARPAVGRLLEPDDDRPGAPTVVVISHGLWTQRFGRDPSVVGRVLRLDAESVTVVGVTEAGFEPAVIDADMWSAARIPPGAPTGMIVLRAIGRVRPDATLALAQERLSAMAQQLDREQISERGAGILLEPIAEELTGPVRVPLLVLMAAVAVVLLMACLNVALLLLVRSADRAKEMTLRAALGASRRRLVVQLLTETSLLATVGAAAGLALTMLSLESLRALAPASLPRLDHVRIDSTVLLFTMAVTVVAALSSGLVPALRASRANLAAVLRDSGASRSTRLHGLVVVAEIAMAVALMAAAGQIVRSFARLQDVDLGFNPERVVAATINLPRSRYSSPQQVRGLYDRVLDRLASSPDITAAGFVSVLPLSGSDTDSSFSIIGRPVTEDQSQEPVAWIRLVSPSYFQTMGILVGEGRGFVATDGPDAPCVVVINRALAQRYWSAMPAIGGRIVALGAACEVVGIASDVHHRGPAAVVEPEMYFSIHQRPPRGPGSVVVRGASSTTAAAAALRAVLRAEDRAIPLDGIRTLESMLGRAVAQPRFLTLLVSAFAVVALGLALIGVHGLLSHGVAVRTREIGVRIAVGAQRGDVARLVARTSALTVIAGVTLGVALAAATARTLETVLFEIEPGDTVSIAAVVILVAIAGSMATLVPSYRAMRVDPIESLRAE